MWRNPNHPAPDQPPRADPEPQGRELATFERPGGRWGPPTELRARLDIYEGHEFINLRVWMQGPDRGWYPTRKGVSVKLREAQGLAEALLEAVRLADTGGQGGSPSRPPARRPGPAPRRAQPRGREQPALPLAGSAAVPPWDNGFSEFQE